MSIKSRARRADVRGIRLVAWFAILGFAAAQVWAYRHAMNPDGMSYLDVARNLGAGDFRATVNGYWSPLYSWILAAALFITGAAPADHFAVAHFTNLVLFVAAFAAFEFLLQECQAAAGSEERIPRAWLVTIGYVAFATATLAWIRVHYVTPDLAVAGWVMLAGALSLRIIRGAGSARSVAALGCVLGLAYLTKAALLPLSIAFIAPVVLLASRRARTLALVAIPLACVAAPYIFALSVSKGRLTTGDVARLNYAWYVDDVRVFKHWQGEDPSNGVPAHPTRKLMDNPATYEFSRPVEGTYPVWYDPSYWHEGMVVQPDVPNQWERLRNEALAVGWIFGRVVWAFVGMAIVIAFRQFKIDGRRALVLSAPLLTSVAMYSLVHIERRFLAGFLVIATMGVLASIRVVGPKGIGLLRGLLVFLAMALLYDVADEAVDVIERLQSASAGNHYAHTAAALRSAGVGQGATIGLIGDGFRAYWAYIGSYRVGAEASPREFWSAPPKARQSAISTMLSSGIGVVIADRRGGCPVKEGWRRVPRTTLCRFVRDRPVGSG